MPHNENGIAVLVRRYEFADVARLYPGAQLFAPGDPRLGWRFDRLLCFVIPANDAERQWAEQFKTALKPGGKWEGYPI